MRGLFEISEDLHFLQDFLTDTGGDITDEAMEAEIDKWLADLGEERDTKIDNYCALVQEFYARAEARKVEAARMTALATVDNNAGDRLKARLLAFFTVHNMDKVETLRFRVSRVNNGGGLPVFIDQEMLDNPVNLPEDYRKVIYEPKRSQIASDLSLLEQARLRYENQKATMDALCETIATLKKAVDYDAEDTVAKEELKVAQVLYEEALNEFQATEAHHRDLEHTLSFARFGERGKHLRIK